MASNSRSPRAFLAKEIRHARATKGMKLEELGKAVYVSESLIRAWEKGRRMPQPDHLVRLEEVLGTNGYLSRVVNDLVSGTVPFEWMGKWLEIERQATSLLTYEPLVIPGLLQAEPYARALLRFSKQTPVDMEEQVSARLARQSILSGEDPPAFVAVIDEAVLHRPIGGPDVMQEQLLHVIDLAERTDIVIQVIPFDVGEYAGLAGAFVIASMDGREFTYLDNAMSGEVIESADGVAAVKRTWEALRGDALPKRASIDLIQKATKKWT
ncbi:MAG: transcriptional regulator, family [Streptosporangiaceae bacterium]|nr:transcriptional regulator, family [Streptosporangiaceae bacterium]